MKTPYEALRKALGKEHDWLPEWAQRLEVRRIGDTTHYFAQPESLSTVGLTELQELIDHGWTVNIDGPRLGRVRIQITPSN